jgi:hypothetical protein
MRTLVYWGCPPGGPPGGRRLVGILWNISRSWLTAASRFSSPSMTLRERASSSSVVWNAPRCSITLRPFSTSSNTGSDSGNLVAPPLGVAPLERGGRAGRCRPALRVATGYNYAGRRLADVRHAHPVRPDLSAGGSPTGWPVGYLGSRRVSSCDDRLGNAVEMDLDEYVVGSIILRRASTLGEGHGHLMFAHSPPEQLLLPL